MKNLNNRRISLCSGIFNAIAFAAMLTLCSCFGSKPISYFSNGVIDTAKVGTVVIPDQLVQKGDLLNITIYSDNPEATAIYNQAGGTQAISNVTTGIAKNSSQAAGGGPTGGGYLVDYNGNIRMHALGTLHVEGLTKNQLSDTIIAKLGTLGVLTNPYCVIRFSNFRISILGEVRNPGVFTLTGEKTSILEAMGMAGDITDYGLKDRVILIREVNGSRTYHNINLLDPGIIESPDYYMRQNDVLLVQADKKKPTAMDIQTLSYITVGATVVSSIAILISLFK